MKEKKHNKMCGPTVGERDANNTTMEASKASSKAAKSDAPVERLLDPPSLAARYACAGLMVAVFGVWGKFSFVEEASAPCIGTPLHSYMVPLVLTSCYILSLPLLRIFSSQYLAKNVDVKLLLKETMVVYNAGQVALNAWMVYRYIDAVVFREHPFIGDIYTVNTGATYAVWIHYCDKYLEFFDTFFMVLRGRMDQVSFLHVYHHISITWAWWIGLYIWPGGDSYFGALLNSWIHVMMYSYYTLSLLKINCPWKRFLTQAQLLQFTSVVIYSICSAKKLYDQQAESKFFVAIAVQVFEMVSLFFLFMHFYSKAYSKKKASSRKSSSDSDNGSDHSVPEQESVSSDSTGDGKKDS